MLPDRTDTVTFTHSDGCMIVADANCGACHGTGKTYPFRFCPNTYSPCACVYTTYKRVLDEGGETR